MLRLLHRFYNGDYVKLHVRFIPMPIELKIENVFQINFTP